MSYIPPRVRRAAEAAGKTVEEYMEEQAAISAAAAAEAMPRNVGMVTRHSPRDADSVAAAAPSALPRRNRRSSSVARRRRRRVTMKGRHLRVNLNTGLGVNAVHHARVEPDDYMNMRTDTYRVTRRSPAVANVNVHAQRVRRRTLGTVMQNRATVGERVPAESLLAINAALKDLETRAALNASNAMAIASIGEQLKDLMDASE